MTAALTQGLVETAALTDVGRVRSENQDACAEIQSSGGSRLLVVADGMGGHQGGSIASRLAVEAMQDVVQRGDLAGEELLEQALDEANARVHGAAVEDAALHGMGTTAVVVLLEERSDGAWIGHVGDSRIYRLRGGRFEQLTEDHSAVAELVRRGVISPEEAETHPRRNEILRSLGVEAEVQPTLARVDLRPGDQLLLCSDGLSGVMSDAEIAEVVANAPPAQAVRTLVDTVNARGAPDNVTVMIAAIGGEDDDDTDIQPILTLPREPAPSNRNLRYLAAAAAGVALALVALLLVLVLERTGVLDGAQMAAPVDAGPDVAAPPEANDRERSP